MAKDRFSNRKINYDYSYRFGNYEPSAKSIRDTSYTQTELIKKMYTSDKINSWEKNFIKNCLRYPTLSQKQKDTLNTIYTKTKN